MNVNWLLASVVLVAYLRGVSCDEPTTCKQHSECPTNMACEPESSQCVDPCLKHTQCGSDASCRIVTEERLAKCRCNPGTLGDPYKSCSSSTYDLLTQGVADVPPPPPETPLK